MKYFIFALLVLAFVTVTRTTFTEEYQVDEVLDLLKSMLTDTETAKSNLIAAHDAKVSSLNEQISLKNQAIANQENKCSGIQDEINDLNDNIDSRNRQIERLRNEASNNTEQIGTLIKERCKRNDFFFQKIGKLYEQIGLYEYLKQIIESKQESDLVLLQMKSTLKAFLQVKIDDEGNEEASDASRNYEKVNKRTEEEIGTDQVDPLVPEPNVNDLEELQMEKLAAVKTELFKILDQLILKAQNDIEFLTKTQLEQNKLVTIIILKLQQRNREIVMIVEKLVGEISVLSDQLKDAIVREADCQAALAQLRQELANLESELDIENATFNADLAKKNKEIRLFEEIIKKYQEKVASIEEDYKSQADKNIQDLKNANP